MEFVLIMICGYEQGSQNRIGPVCQTGPTGNRTPMTRDSRDKKKSREEYHLQQWTRKGQTRFLLPPLSSQSHENLMRCEKNREEWMGLYSRVCVQSVEYAAIK